MSINELSAWVYTGPPANFSLKYYFEDYQNIDGFCCEFLTFTTEKQRGGTYIKIVTQKEYGDGGYSKSFCEKLKKVFPDVYCTLSGKSTTGVSLMLADDKCVKKSIQKVVNFCSNNGIGLDLNIEGLADFTAEECEKHADFINRLGMACNKAGVPYRVVTVAENGSLWHGHWRNKLLAGVICNRIVMMCYDVQYDHADSSITPHDWLKDVINYAKVWMGNAFNDKFVCGLPNYGFRAEKDTWWPITLLTKYQLDFRGIQLTQRAVDSSELMGFDDEYVYHLNDTKAIEDNTKIGIDLGCSRFCIWHAGGGNGWYSDKFLDTYMNPHYSEIDPEHTEVSEEYKDDTHEFTMTISSKDKAQLEGIVYILNKLVDDTVKVSIKF